MKYDSSLAIPRPMKRILYWSDEKGSDEMIRQMRLKNISCDSRYTLESMKTDSFSFFVLLQIQNYGSEVMGGLSTFQVLVFRSSTNIFMMVEYDKVNPQIIKVGESVFTVKEAYLQVNYPEEPIRTFRIYPSKTVLNFKAIVNSSNCSPTYPAGRYFFEVNIPPKEVPVPSTITKSVITEPNKNSTDSIYITNTILRVFIATKTISKTTTTSNATSTLISTSFISNTTPSASVTKSLISELYKTGSVSVYISNAFTRNTTEATKRLNSNEPILTAISSSLSTHFILNRTSSASVTKSVLINPDKNGSESSYFVNTHVIDTMKAETYVSLITSISISTSISLSTTLLSNKTLSASKSAISEPHKSVSGSNYITKTPLTDTIIKATLSMNSTTPILTVPSTSLFTHVISNRTAPAAVTNSVKSEADKRSSGLGYITNTTVKYTSKATKLVTSTTSISISILPLESTPFMSNGTPSISVTQSVVSEPNKTTSESGYSTKTYMSSTTPISTSLSTSLSISLSKPSIPNRTPYSSLTKSVISKPGVSRSGYFTSTPSMNDTVIAKTYVSKSVAFNSTTTLRKMETRTVSPISVIPSTTPRQFVTNVTSAETFREQTLTTLLMASNVSLAQIKTSLEIPFTTSINSKINKTTSGKSSTIIFRTVTETITGKLSTGQSIRSSETSTSIGITAASNSKHVASSFTFVSMVNNTTIQSVTSAVQSATTTTPVTVIGEWTTWTAVSGCIRVQKSYVKQFKRSCTNSSPGNKIRCIGNSHKSEPCSPDTKKPLTMSRVAKATCKMTLKDLKINGKITTNKALQNIVSEKGKIYNELKNETEVSLFLLYKKTIPNLKRVTVLELSVGSLVVDYIVEIEVKSSEPIKWKKFNPIQNTTSLFDGNSRFKATTSPQLIEISGNYMFFLQVDINET